MLLTFGFIWFNAGLLYIFFCTPRNPQNLKSTTLLVFLNCSSKNRVFRKGAGWFRAAIVTVFVSGIAKSSSDLFFQNLNGKWEPSW